MAVIFYVTLCLLCTAAELVNGDPDGSEVYLDSFFVDEGEEIRKIAINGADVLVATDEFLYRLSYDLAERQRQLIVPTLSTRLFLATNSGPGQDVVLLCGMSCRLVSAGDIGRRVWPTGSTRPSPLVLSTSLAARFTGLLRRGVGPGRYELTYAQNDFIDNSRESVASRIVRGNIIRRQRDVPGGKPDRYEMTASQIELDPDQDREFIHAFARNGFAYFVSAMSSPSGVLQARVARVYGSDDTDAGNGTSLFCSYIELALQCGDLSGEPTAATFISAPNAFGADAIVLSARMTRLSEVRNRLCAFNLTRIDEMMDEKIFECDNGIGLEGLTRNAAHQTPCTPLRVCMHHTVTCTHACMHACMHTPVKVYVYSSNVNITVTKYMTYIGVHENCMGECTPRS